MHEATENRLLQLDKLPIIRSGRERKKNWISCRLSDVIVRNSVIKAGVCEGRRADVAHGKTDHLRKIMQVY